MVFFGVVSNIFSKPKLNENNDDFLKELKKNPW